MGIRALSPWVNKIGVVGRAGSAGVGFIIHPQLASYTLSRNGFRISWSLVNTYSMRVSIGLMLVEA